MLVYCRILNTCTCTCMASLLKNVYYYNTVYMYTCSVLQDAKYMYVLWLHYLKMFILIHCMLVYCTCTVLQDTKYMYVWLH